MRPTILHPLVLLSLGLMLPHATVAQETPAAPAEESAATDPTADLGAAAEKLASATSYAWSQTTAFGNMGERTTTGKKGSGGFLLVTMPGRDGDFKVLSRKGRAAMERDGKWERPDADGQERGPGRWIARMVQNLGEPAQEAKELIGKATDLKSEDGKVRGTLGEEAAKELMSFRGFGRRGGGGGGGGGNFTPPEVTGAGGSVVFHVTDGTLTGYELTLTGRMNFNGQDRDVNRTTKVSFTGVGSTSFDIPEAAVGLLMD